MQQTASYSRDEQRPRVFAGTGGACQKTAMKPRNVDFSRRERRTATYGSASRRRGHQAQATHAAWQTRCKASRKRKQAAARFPILERDAAYSSPYVWAAVVVLGVAFGLAFAIGIAAG